MKFSEFTLSKCLVEAARHEDEELTNEWFRAVLVEAVYGPDKEEDIDCLQTLCRCAGVWLTRVKDSLLWNDWFNFLDKLRNRFKSFEVWNSFFGGVGMCLGEKWGNELRRWHVPAGKYYVTLSLAQQLAPAAKTLSGKCHWSFVISHW